MRSFDNDGKLLCDMQAKIFETSLNYPASSPIFIRRFMNSTVAEAMDDVHYLDRSDSPDAVFAEIDRQYGATSYGKIKYSANELDWIGYLYRYWAYTYEWSSKKIYQTVSAREMDRLYQVYHTLDPAQAIERILEAKGLCIQTNEKDVNRICEGAAILRRIREESAQ